MSKEIKYPATKKYWIVHNADGSVMHTGETEPNQVTSTGLDTLDSSDTEEGLVTIIASKDANMFPDIPEQGQLCEKGKIYKYGTDKVKCLQQHTRTHYAPENTPALFLIIQTVSDYPVWTQPAGAHDAYMEGDIVWYPDKSGNKYESLIDNNVWSPVDYPQGWKKL